MVSGALSALGPSLLRGSSPSGITQGLHAVSPRRRLLGVGLAVALVLLLVPAAQAGYLGLAWDAPTTSADGTSLTDLSGYRVYSGTSSLTSCPPGSTPQFVASATPAPSPGTVVTYQLTGLTDGTTYFVRVTAVDTSGNESTCSNEASAAALPALDTTPPTVALTAPPSSATVAGSVTVSATASDNVAVVGVQFRVDGAPLGAEDLIPSYSVSWNTTTATNGSHTLTAVARDAAGNTTTSGGITVTVDNSPPTVAITAPASGATVSGTVTVSATASDNRAVVGVQFRVDGASIGAEDSTSPYSLSWSTTTVGDGSHTLTAIARDAAGNTTTSIGVSVTVSNGDTTPPTVAITAPSSGASVAGTITVAATATDTVGVVGVQFRLDGATLGAEDTTSPYSVSWNTTTATNGSHALTAVARDAAGNTTTSSGITVTVDNSAPTGALTVNGNAAYTNSTAATLNLSGTDAVGVVGYYRATSSTPPSPTAAGWVAVTSTTSFSANVAYTLSSGDGTKTVYAWYKDAAGNVSGTASDAILLDQTLPTNGTLTATAGNGQVVLSWSGFSDGGSGLAGTTPYKLVFATGGVPAASCTSGTQLLLGTATSFTHTGLTNGTSYSYRVCASDNAGNISTGATASATPQAADTSPPTVTITSPTSSATYSTGSSPLTLGGTAADNLGVTQVTWASDRGGSGTASGTTSWTASGVVLQLGTNVLTVTARDAAGNTGTDTLTVTYTPSDTTPPAAVTDLTASNVSNTSLDLTWTAPGDDGTTGQAKNYDLRYSTSSITLSNWASATPLTGLPTPKPAGSQETYTVRGLTPKTTYYFALRTLDEVPNISPLSNGLNLITRKEPPPARNFKARLGSVILTWDLPAVPQEVPFPIQVVIRRTVAAPAVSPTDGVFIYEGSGTSAVDCTVTPQTYFYTAFVYEEGDRANVSTPSALSIAVPSAAGPASLTVRTLPGTRTFLGGNYGYLGTFGGIVSQSGELRVEGLPAGKYVLRTRLAGFVDGYRLVQLCSGENVVPLDLVRFDPMAPLDPTARALEGGGAAIRGGGASAPFVVDWDADGKKDLLVAGGDGAIVLYRNGGSDAAPQFSASEPIMADGTPISVPGPAFVFVVDWDGDGNKDLVVGDGDGRVRWYRNTLADATPQLTAWGFLQAGGVEVQVTGPAAPIVVDWNTDGQKDLLVGDGAGSVKVFLNAGTDANPVLVAGVTIPLPEVGALRGNTRPFVTDWNQDGRQDLLVGDANGRTYVFLNAETDAAPGFPSGAPLTGQGAPVAVSSQAVPFVVDWDNDGLRDLVIGSNDGEVFLIQGAAGPVPSGGGGGGSGAGAGGCFIATAAYGSPLEPRVVLLRAFRDRYLVTNPTGQAFVQWYYRTSPPLAARIRQSPSLRGLVQGLLWPLVGLAWLALNPGVGSAVLVGAGGITGWIWYRRRKSHRTQP